MLFRWRKKQRLARFYRMTRGIFDTPPMPVRDAPWTIVSMMTGNYVQLYLLAIKSFYAQMQCGKIVVVTDRNLSAESRATLEHHLPGIRFELQEEIDTGACQRGGTWERLVYLLDLSQSEYAIQLDCDTLTVGDVDEVLRAIRDNVAFTHVGRPRPIIGVAQAAEDARNTEGDYIGVVAERMLDRYPDAGAKYVRGSSGFTGFAKGGFSRARIEDFHRNMEKLLANRWSEWGTEQCGANFVVANSPGAIVLPHPKYAVFTENLARGRSSFLHFIGSNRYLDDYYARCARDVIARLMRAERRDAA